MKFPRQAFLLILTSISLLVFAGCATSPAFDPSLPDVTVSRASEADIKAFGRNFYENPYMEPRTLIRGKLNEFFVVKLQLNLATTSRVSVLAEVVSPDKKPVAKAFDAQGFEEFWKANTFKEEDNDAQNQRRLTVIQRSCLPAMDFTQRAGRTVLLLPMVGANPIPRPAYIHIQVTAGQGEPVSYSYVLE